jgi:iron(III) transport system substrate-binding protein
MSDYSKWLRAVTVLLLVLPLLGAANDLNVISSFPRKESEYYFDEFEKMTGIKVKVVQFSPVLAMEKLRRNDSNVQDYSVWVGVPEHVLKRSQADGLLAPFSGPDCAEESNWVALYKRVLAFAYSDLIVTEQGIPLSWRDILSLAYVRSISLASPIHSETGYAIVKNIEIVYGNEFREKLKALISNTRRFNKSSSTCLTQVEVRDVAVCITFADEIRARMNKGANFNISFPEEGSVFELGGAALLKNGKNLEVAKILLEWFTSDHAKRMMITAGRIPVNWRPETDNVDFKWYPERTFYLDLKKDLGSLKFIWEELCSEESVC